MNEQYLKRILDWNSSVTIRLGEDTEQDAEGFAKLFNATYDRKVGPDYYRWQFFQREGDSNKVVLADYRGEIVGCYGYVPTAIALGDRSVPVALVSDQIVAEAHRRTGLWYLLEHEVQQLCKSAGLSALYATPNKPGLSIKIADGWSMIQQMGFWSIKLDESASTANRNIREVSGFSSLHAESLQGFKVLMPKMPILSRDPDWGEWRFSKPASSPYRTFEMTVDNEIFGYVTARIFPLAGCVDIIDYGWKRDDPSTAGNMLVAVANIVGAGNIDEALTWATDNTPAVEALQAGGFVCRENNPRPLCVKWISSECELIGFADHPWLITMADSDLF